MNNDTEQTPMYLAYIVVGAIVALALIELTFRGVA